MYKHERKMLHQTHVQIPAKIWTLIFKNHESMTPHSRKKTVCKKCCQTCNHQANINNNISNNSVVSRVWAPALAYATLFRKHRGHASRESNKQRQIIHIKNNHVNGMFCVNKGPQPRFVGHNPGILLGFETFTAASLNKEATS